nr:ATP-binding protein [Parabacteroides pacaensis]
MMHIERDKKSRISFSQRLFWSVFAMFLGFTICFLIFQYQREKEFAQEKLNTILGNYNYQLYNRLKGQSDYTTGVREFIDEIPQKELRVTIISPAGKVLFDNTGDVDIHDFNNHNDRSEVRKAKMYKEGFAIRESTTLGKKFFYSATLINGYIYRSALPYDTYVKGILSIDNDFIYFLALMTLIFFFVLSRFTFSIGKTIAKLRDFASHVENDKALGTTYVFPDDELGDISQNIVTLYHKQQVAQEELWLERDKIIKHFKYSKEGFAMFTANGKEILSNILFIQIANFISDTQIKQPEETLEKVKELFPIQQFLQSNIHNKTRKRKVLRETVTIDKNGKIFLVECILFLDNSYELAINDITRQEEETRMKRQLTQNVAHELKTPVSSIQGYLETILSNPDLPVEKKQFFLERCYTQSTRLAGLLRDISVLNRLDEASGLFDLTDVNLTKLINEIRKECSKEMEEKRITVKSSLPENPTIYGNYSLLYSIFRNLFDNALAYAGEGIQITIHCYREDPSFYYFSFSDNGVGVPDEHINRLFERFYRVDKGRSRKIGGTGLGLSIVKNGVNFHKGQISAKNRPEGGLEILFTLKKKL